MNETYFERNKNGELDYMLALLTIDNDEIQETEKRRRWKCIAPSGRARANRDCRTLNFRRFDRNEEVFPNEQWRERFKIAKEAIEEVPLKHLEQTGRRTSLWLSEEKQRWREDMRRNQDIWRNLRNGAN
jgi:hypothetical protein